ncbi:MAG: DUF368 domain-containing protein [Planctomycetes bacterium]|nr:DUF368 domain-containing protein [Planctomycetota bacterium]
MIESNSTEHEPPRPVPRAPLPLARSGVAGVLMGLANLVPGISGGTMIVITGLYDEFIESIADVTRLHFTKRNLTFVGILACAAGLAIATLAGTLSRAVTLHPSAMYSLFIGLTLGGVPLLVKMLPRVTTGAVIGGVVGLSIMVTVAVTKDEPPNRDAVREAVAQGTFVLEPAYERDVAAGILGMSAMVLPGISGAYMLLVLGRYETILAAIALAKTYAFSLGGEGELGTALRILVPTAIGAILSIVLVSNLLKWMLHRHRATTIGLLLGILGGSIFGIWPFEATSQMADYLFGLFLAVAGFAITLLLSRLSA